jgi:predicted transposase/invertase (TIGR01784 family)
MIAKRLKTAEDYQKINKTVAINILDFDLLEQTNRFHNVFRFKEVHTNIELTDVAEIHMMELPELRRYITDHREDVKREIGKNVLLDWLLFIDNPESELSKLITKRVPEIEGAMEMLYKLSQDDILREQYEAREKAMRDRLSAEAEKERRIKEAEKLGMEKGVEKGMEKVLWKIIQKKFPLITPFYYDKLIQLNSEKLDILSAELLDMKTIQDLDAFLSEES